MRSRMLRRIFQRAIVTAALLAPAGAAEAACVIDGIQSISGLTAALGTYNITTPGTQTLSLTLVLNKTGNGQCSGTLGFLGSVSPAQMTGPGVPKLNYNVMNTGGTSILYTSTPGTRVAILGTNNNQSTVTVTASITVGAVAGQTGRPAGSYSDTSVVAKVFEGASNTPVGGAAPALNVSATVVGSCTIGGVNTPSADTATIPVNASGNVVTTAINRSYVSVVCSGISNVQLTSLNGAVKSSATAVSGFSKLINYSATATFFGASATLNTATIPTATGSESGSASSTSSGSPSGTMSVAITPAANTSPLLAGSYTDTLRITITPQ
jgi:hypothetical protein